MSFLAPAGFALLGLVPLIAILYFLKLHANPKVVSSTYLWRRTLDAYRVNRPFQRFQNRLLLWVQILLVTLLVLAIARPVVEGRRETSEVHIFLVDHSASMNVREEDGETRLELARKVVGGAIRGKREHDRMAILGFSDRSFLAAPLTADTEDLLAALSRIEPTSRPTRIDEAWATALSIAREFDVSDVYLVSDGGFGELERLTQANAVVHYVPVGSFSANAGVVHVATEREGEGLEIFARVANAGRETARPRIELRIDGRLVDARDVRVPARGETGVAFRRREGEGKVAEVRIAGGDAFPEDDSAWVALEAAEPLSVLYVGDEDPFLVEGLRSHPEVALERLSPSDFESGGGGGMGHDLVVLDGVSPRALSPGAWAIFGALPPSGGFEGNEVENPVVLSWDREHPLARYANFSTLHVSRMTAGASPPWLAPVLSTDRGPAILAGEREGARLVLVRFRILDSDWPLRLSFPLFLANLVGWAREGDFPAASEVVRPGTPLVVSAPVDSAGGTLVRPDGSEEEIGIHPDRRAVVADTETPGVYRIRWDGRRRESVHPVHLLDARETDVAVPEAVTMGDQALSGSVGDIWVKKEYLKSLVSAGILVLLAEWILYVRARR